MNEPEKKTSQQWYEQVKEHFTILDADGWDRTNYDFSFNQELITKEEFERRLSNSTVLADWRKTTDILTDFIKNT